MKNKRLWHCLLIVCALVVLGVLPACQRSESKEKLPALFEISGTVRFEKLDEISGIQADSEGRWWVHNDDGGELLYLINATGDVLQSVKLKGAKNKDWEDITAFSMGKQRYLVIGDFGDNSARRESVQLYFIAWPEPDQGGQYYKKLPPVHTLNLRYPDGPRDCEAIAFDSSTGTLLMMSKRDVPPQLYGIPVELALSESEALLEPLGIVRGFRSPQPEDLLLSPKRGAWVSQPTGMDISPDGRIAAVITYRSLYLFQREADETWPERFARGDAIELIGPPGNFEEAVGFDPSGSSLTVATEGLPAPLHRLQLAGVFQQEAQPNQASSSP